MIVVITTDNGHESSISIEGYSARVGSALDCDVIVAGTPALWFTIISHTGRGHSRPKIQIGPDAEGYRIARNLSGFVVRGHGLTARVAGPTLLSGVRERFNSWEPLRRLSRSRVAQLVACVAVLLCGFAWTLRTSDESFGARIPIHRASTSLPGPPLLDVGEQLRASLSSIGVGAKLTVLRSSGGLVVDGDVTPAEAQDIHRIIRDAASLGNEPITERIRTVSDPPRISIKAVSTQPEFVVLENGRRVFPGNKIDAAWVLRRVDRSNLLLEANGQTVTVRIPENPL